MTETERAYIAGIIDGEGSIMLEKVHFNQFPSPCISIASTTIELLKWIKETLSCGTIKRKKNYNTFKHKDSYVYIIRYDKAIEILELIYPYLIIESKKQRANLILTDYKRLTPRNGRYSENLLKEKLRFYDKFISIK